MNIVDNFLINLGKGECKQMLFKISTEPVGFVILYLYLLTVVNGKKEYDKTTFNGYPEEALANFTEFAGKYGYKSEEHTVVTEDGYILSLFRIPRGRHCLGPVRKPPVLLMHGLLQNSDSWLNAGPSAGLAFLISDACYDLWAGNVRGTNYGRRHVRLNPDTDSEFWEHSTQEMGVYDLPAMIDHILNITQSTQLNYIGFSQGGRIFYIMCSETIGYCEKIKSSISVAPAVIIRYIESIPLISLIKFYATVEQFLSTPRELEVLPKGGLIQKSVSFACKNTIAAATACNAILIFINSSPIPVRTVKVVFGHVPAGTSARNLAFYGQNVMQKTFRHYDYGPIRNKELYGTDEPAAYNLSRTTVPNILIYSKSDTCVDPRNLRLLADQLPNVVELYEVEDPSWTHLDNTYSPSTKRFIFPKIVQYLNKYSNF